MELSMKNDGKKKKKKDPFPPKCMNFYWNLSLKK